MSVKTGTRLWDILKPSLSVKCSEHGRMLGNRSQTWRLLDGGSREELRGPFGRKMPIQIKQALHCFQISYCTSNAIS